MSAGPSTIPQVSSNSGGDVVAIFHTSFHPTQGNTVDWCLKAPGWEDLQHDHLSLEFSALPSGLHQVDEDVVYFTASASKASASPRLFHALSLFRRRRTPNPTYRGFLLSALGVLVIPSHADASKNGVQKPRPWQHVSALKEIAERCYSRPGSDPSATPATAALVDVELSAEVEEWYAPARAFLAERGVASFSLQNFLSSSNEHPSLPSDSESAELLDLRHELASAEKENIPALQLPSLVSLLGPSSVTLFKHLLARKRVMIYTNVPVGPACTMCYAIVDMVRGMQTDSLSEEEEMAMPPQHKGPVRVLGMLTLNDLVQDQKRGLLENKIDEGSGWVACTTDALFLEKPQYYDLLIDLTALPAYSSLSSSSSATGFYAGGSSAPVSSSSRMPGDANGKKPSNFASNRPRPTFYVSKAIPLGPGTRPFYKLSQIRWAWSDVRLWNDLDRVLRSTPAYEPAKSRPSSSDPSPSSPALQPSTSTASSSSSASHGTPISKPKKQKSKSKSRERRNRGDSQSGSSSSALSRPQSLGALGSRTTPTIPTSLTDAWKVYEDMCLVCANAWMGALCARAGGGPLSPSVSQSCLHPSGPCSIPPAPIQAPTIPPVTVTEPEPSGKSTAIQLEGEDDILLRTVRGPGDLSPGILAKMRDPSSSSYATYTSTLVGDETIESKPIDAAVLGALPVSTAIACEALSADHATTLNLLHTFDRYASWQIGVLRTYVKSLVGNNTLEEGSQVKLTLTPRDLVLLDLNPLSSGDVKYLEALLKEYAGHVVITVQDDQEGENVGEEVPAAVEGEAPRLSFRSKAKAARDVSVELVVKRGWKELFGVVFGFA
ncbi:hypothetical protein BKA70DRAFT_13308 [Coprinopsis sp. MPI-PUGE-AT-0042]|nr:hypothetical protein BKA70DRAFT_13308 [Coprinopsis sp. MPI-PUGE-AT-0042]